MKSFYVSYYVGHMPYEEIIEGDNATDVYNALVDKYDGNVESINIKLYSTDRGE